MRPVTLPDSSAAAGPMRSAPGLFLLTLAGGLAVCVAVLACAGCRAVRPGEGRLQADWAGYKNAFIVNGRVLRPKDHRDTVSEGQAYAMLRSAWMRDKRAFDECYRWTEANLSRGQRFGDNLLAWHWGKGGDGKEQVLDWTAASDADLDYALALLLAAEVWPDGQPKGLPAYREKALGVAGDILRKEVVKLSGGELALSPWPQQQADKDGLLLVNPSYFSPAHYRAFHRATGDATWKKLVDDSYSQLGRMLERLGDKKGVGLAPDWCVLDGKGMPFPSKERGTGSSWDAFRLWWRVGLDWKGSGDGRARDLLERHLVPFLAKETAAHSGMVYVEYNYSGEAVKAYSSPAVLGTYAWAVSDITPSLSETLRRKLQEHVVVAGQMVFYGDREDYYVNSWAWFGDVATQDFVSTGSRKE